MEETLSIGTLYGRTSVLLRSGSRKVDLELEMPSVPSKFD